MAEPRISVVVPAHDAERYLAEAIRSVLAQTLLPAEVVVVDDGSTDETARIAAAFGGPVVLVRQARGGPGAARNAGAARARGELTAFLDADDVWMPDALEACAAVLAAGEGDIVRGLVRQFASPETGRTMPEDERPGIVPGAAMVTREAWETVGPFRADLQFGEFLDWLLRARRLGLREIVLDRHLLWRRVHATNHTLVARERMGDYARVLKGELDRRRRGEAAS